MRRVMLLLTVILSLSLVACAPQDPAQQATAESANLGRGALDYPVGRGIAVNFPEMSITPLQIIRPANNRVAGMSDLNEDPAAGTDWVLVQFRLTCHKTGSALCNGREPSFALIDQEGNEWPVPFFLVIDDHFDAEEAAPGYSFTGWDAFEFPQTATIRAIRIRVGGATLYASPPP